MEKTVPSLRVVIGFQDYIALVVATCGVISLFLNQMNEFWLLPSFLVLFTSVIFERKLQFFLIINSVCLFIVSKALDFNFSGISTSEILMINFTSLSSSSVVAIIGNFYIVIILIISAISSMFLTFLRKGNDKSNNLTLTYFSIFFSSLLISIILGRELAHQIAYTFIFVKDDLIISYVPLFIQTASSISVMILFFLLITSVCYFALSLNFIGAALLHKLLQKSNLHFKIQKKDYQEKKKRIKEREGL